MEEADVFPNPRCYVDGTPARSNKGEGQEFVRLISDCGLALVYMSEVSLFSRALSLYGA